MHCEATIDRIKNSIALIFVVRSTNEVVSKGSGFVFLKKGIVVTCNHVLADRDSSIVCKFPDRMDFFQAKVVLRDEEHDIALLRITDESIPPLEEENEENVKEGMPVLFSGYPLNLQNLTTHQGILSAIIKDATGVTTYLIDGTINSGNSGCPLLTENGKVIGIVNAKQREFSDLLAKTEEIAIGAVSIHGLDLVAILKAIISNTQLGIGYAIPCRYIPKQGDDPSKGITTS